MSRTRDVVLQHKIGVQTVGLKSWKTFGVKGQSYRIIRFGEHNGPNLQQSIELAEIMIGEMLTSLEAQQIIRSESSIAFGNALKQGEWSYVRDLDAEKRSQAVWLAKIEYDKGLVVHLSSKPELASIVLILKIGRAAETKTRVELRKDKV